MVLHYPSHQYECMVPWYCIIPATSSDVRKLSFYIYCQSLKQLDDEEDFSEARSYCQECYMSPYWLQCRMCGQDYTGAPWYDDDKALAN